MRRATPLTSRAEAITTISIHALLAESDESESPVIAYDNDFYPRSPCGERQAANGLANAPPQISIHALLAESDSLGLLGWLRVLISIHALLAESDSPPDSCYLDNIISIHALLAESDRTGLTCGAGQNISIHALLAESDGGFGAGSWRRGIFLSTLSLRRATLAPKPKTKATEFLSTLSLRRATSDAKGTSI